MAAEHYWDDVVYRYLSRKHREASDSGDTSEVERLGGLLQQVMDQTMEETRYDAFETEARTERKTRKRMKPRRSVPKTRTAINTAELKKRIYNPKVSRENMIKALEALPAGERKATIEGLSPGLKRKLGTYLKKP